MKDLKSNIEEVTEEVVDEKGSENTDELLNTEGEVGDNQNETKEPAKETKIEDIVARVVGKKTAKHKEQMNAKEEEINQLKGENEDLISNIKSLEERLNIIESNIESEKNSINEKRVSEKVELMRKDGVPAQIIEDLSKLGIENFINLDHTKYVSKVNVPLSDVKEPKEDDVKEDIEGMVKKLFKR